MPFEYHLYRAKFIKPKEMALFGEEETPASLFLKSILAKPNSVFRKRFIWKIGNLAPLGDTTGSFAVGRMTTATLPKFDATTGNFIDVRDSQSPYTHVVYDAKIGLMAIQKKTELAADTEQLASKIERMLQQTEPIIHSGASVKIDLIPDPEGFISKIRQAVEIKKFTAYFTGPNPFDADAFFQKPLSAYLRAVNGSRGKTTVEGTNLDSETVEEVARSTSSTGNSATALIKEEEGQRAVTVAMHGNPVRLQFTDEEHTPERVLHSAQITYNRLRNERAET